MGYNLNRFQEEIDPNLTCAICSGVLEEAVLTPCGHSFCSLCIQTWLLRPNSSPSCPECRGRVHREDTRPVHSLRSLINALEIDCEHSQRGCRDAVKIESLAHHQSNCKFMPIECAGCGFVVNRIDLSDHQINCKAIAAAIRDEDDVCNSTSSMSSYSSLPPAHPSLQRNPSHDHFCTCCMMGNATSSDPAAFASHSQSHSGDFLRATSLPCEITDLACRIASLEIQLKNMKRDLDIADRKNKLLDRDLKEAKSELESRRLSKVEQKCAEFDPSYGYGFEERSVHKLSLLLNRFLMKRPNYIDRDRIFIAIRRCYDRFGKENGDLERAVNMLVSTAYASNWFTDSQNLNFYIWLQNLMKSRRFSSDSENFE